MKYIENKKSIYQMIKIPTKVKRMKDSERQIFLIHTFNTHKKRHKRKRDEN